MNDGGQKSWKQFIIRFLRVAILSYIGVVLLMAGLQHRFIYFPTVESEEDLRSYADAVGMEPWKCRAGRLHGWRATEPEPHEAEAHVVVFHGNSGHALYRVHYRDSFLYASAGRWLVHILEYPGFGAREGRPGEESFYNAAREALELLWEDAYGRPIYLVGESLGSGVASRMAADFPNKIAGLLLVTPFTSLADVAARHFWFLPARIILRERYDNVSALASYHGPVAVLLAGDDEVVPVDLGKRLYEGYAGPKRFWIKDGRGHNELDLGPRNPWWLELVEFLREPAPAVAE